MRNEIEEAIMALVFEEFSKSKKFRRLSMDRQGELVVEVVKTLKNTITTICNEL